MGNSGPYILAAAIVTFAGVLLGLWWQGVQANRDREKRTEEAERDRQHTLQLAREEREAQEARAHRDWYRQERFKAYCDVLNQSVLILGVNRGVTVTETNMIAAAFMTATEIAAVMADNERAAELRRLRQRLVQEVTRESDESKAGAVAFEIRDVVSSLIAELEVEK